MRGIWITWEHQRRNKGLSSALDWPLYEIIYNRTRIFRYFLSIIKTFAVITKKKPKIIAVQNPSIILASFVLLLKKIFNFFLIIDAHNSGIFPLEGKSTIFMIISKILQKHADLTIVTNNKLKEIVEFNKGKAIVLPDRIPDIPEKLEKNFPLDYGCKNIAFICTFSEDEPYNEVLDSINFLPENIQIYVTGKYNGKIDKTQISSNIHLLGFISDSEYWKLLNSVDLILDLTLREDCLVCGAYEAVALSKPIILSDTEVLKEYFSKGCVYVKTTAMTIANGILEAIHNQKKLEREMACFQIFIQKNWNNQFQIFKKSILKEVYLDNCPKQR